VKADHRIERDSLGEIEVPGSAYYGAQTERARRNFPVSGLRLPRASCAAMAMIKREAAAVNAELGRRCRGRLGDRRAAEEVVGRASTPTTSRSTSSRPAPAPRPT
jgi:fumarate hydratase, class II